MKISKRKLFLIIYGLVVLGLLICILFVFDDSFFVKKNNKIEENKKTEIKFVSYEKQIEKLKNNIYDYDYKIDYNSVQYRCHGSKNKDKDKGSCTQPKKVDYTEKNYNDVYDKLNTDYLDVNKIFDLLKDIKPKKNTYGSIRNYVYNIVLDKLKTEVIIFTDEHNITQISIANGYETYILTFSNIKN